MIVWGFLRCSIPATRRTTASDMLLLTPPGILTEAYVVRKPA
jgi:hypothetical protein